MRISATCWAAAGLGGGRDECKTWQHGGEWVRRGGHGAAGATVAGAARQRQRQQGTRTRRRERMPAGGRLHTHRRVHRRFRRRFRRRVRGEDRRVACQECTELHRLRKREGCHTDRIEHTARGELSPHSDIVPRCTAASRIAGCGKSYSGAGRAGRTGGISGRSCCVVGESICNVDQGSVCRSARGVIA